MNLCLEEDEKEHDKGAKKKCEQKSVMMKREGNFVPLASYLQYPSSVLFHCKTRSSQSHYQPASILERGHGSILPPGVSSSLLVLYGGLLGRPGNRDVQAPRAFKHHITAVTETPS